jgi:3-hydroxyacyl-CoA dehydrogenase
VTKIAVVGAGFIGRAWAITFARAGYAVALWDQNLEASQRALDFIRSVLPDLAANDLLNGRSPDDILADIRVETELSLSLAGTTYIQENTLEDLKVKTQVFAALDEMAPSAASIASSTSAILPSLFTEHLHGRRRCLVVHPINPPYLIRATEIVPAPWTSPEVVERTRLLMLAIGQAPIVMKQELDGFIMNRLQGALLEEAFRLVADGHASIEDVDIGLREGLALRWSFMGPFETIDLNAPGGVRDYVSRYQGIYENIFPSTLRRVDWAGPVLAVVERDRRKQLANVDLARRQTWRDRTLMALVAHKRRTAKDLD